jgi:hypothetical protein
MDAPKVGKKNVEEAKRKLSENREKWNRLAAHNLAYTLRRFTTGIPLPGCNLVPVRVTIRHDKVVSVTYAATEGDCRVGMRVNKTTYSDPIATPRDLFKFVEDSPVPTGDNRADCGFIVTYDATLGIPTKIAGGCPWMIDAAWSIEVSDVVLDR